MKNMIIRTLTRAAAPRTVISVARRAPVRGFKACRRYSTSQSTMSGAPAPQSQASMLATITTDLDRIAPRFEIQPSQIHIMRTPTEFYETLKSKILSAQSRVYLSTLYIGKTEHELISTVRTALARNSNLKVSFLVDALRGTRETPNPCSASLLAPLISEFGSSRVEVRLFHTPNLTGLRKKVVPRRINEGWGLQHMKLYGVDDEIIMSGANLSSNYFTDRQDRYHLFSSKELADYFERIYGGICKLSFDVQPSDEPAGYTMSWPTSNPSVSPLDNPKAFRKSATKLLAPLLTPSNSPLSAPSKPSGSSTTIYPIMSFVPLLTPNTSTELPALTTILTHLASPPFHPSTWTFTAGYFNTTAKFRRLLLSTRPAHGTILTAHPHANGFYGSKGVSGMLPDAYTYLARSFLRRIRMEGLEDSIEMREWKRGCIGEPGGWTYHAKGFWVAFPSMEQQQQSLKSGQGHPLDAQNATDPDPSISVIGSSNYTKRAYEMDLEANVLICTSDADLKRRLGEEVKWLKEYANKVDETEFKKPERRVGLGVKFSMWLVRVLGGAL